jgi:hypothetical protein
VLGRIIGVDEDVVQIYYDVDVQQVGKNSVQEALEGSRSIGKTLRYDPEVVGAIASAKGGFIFIASSDPEKMVSVFEIKFSIDTCLSRGIEKVRDQQKQIAVLLGDAVKPTVVEAQPERTVLLPGEEDQSSVG